MPKIFDNIENKFSTGLSEHLTGANRVDYCVGYFNLRGWGLTADGIGQLAGATIKEGTNNVTRYCRLLIGMTKVPRDELLEDLSDPDDLLMDNEKASRYRKRLAVELAGQLTYGYPTRDDERTLQTLLEQLKSRRVVVKLFLKHQLHAKLYLTHSSDRITPVVSLLGSSNFTLAGLSKQGELNVDVLDQDAAKKLDEWFNNRWLDRWCVDITNDLIETLENSWARPELIPPYLIYLKIAYHLSREARAGLAEFSLSREFSDELLDYQQAAVKIAAHRLHHRRGVMIGDVVGLGKTITATAIAHILENDLYYNTLITCPKNLVQMWEGYQAKYGLHACVISHSVLRQALPKLKRYKLVIIDESHNFRNNLGKTYRALKSYIDENDSRVILLSATPYNKSYVDLSNQLKLFLPEDYDLGIIPERYIDSLGGIVQFTAKHTETNIRTISAFEKSFFADDWREVMKLYLLRRTRSFIKANYAKTDSLSGRKYLEFSTGKKSFFPDRIPKKIEFSLDAGDPADQYAALYDVTVVDAINALNLPRYGLQRYYDNNPSTKPTENEVVIMGNLSRAGKSAIGFCRTNLYKRLESGGYPFLVSLSRHVLRNYVFLYAIQRGLQLPVSGSSVAMDIYSDDEDAGLNMDFGWTAVDYETKASNFYNILKQGNKNNFDWIRSTLFNAKTLISDLKTDTFNLLAVLANISVWKPVNDRKLIALLDLVNKIHKREKLLVFTQFADTAKYIHEQLTASGVDNTALVVGGSDDMVDLTTRFSPISNGCPDMPKDSQIRILVTTDVLSEGQNLQDAHIIVNFDLPWAIVRLIQRAGRVDRLGQISPKILCYSFLPEDGIERIIGLRRRLRTRISENAEVVGSDEVFFDGDPINISDFYNEKSGILDDGDDTEVDLASLAYQIWKNAIEARPDVKKKVEDMPNVVFGAKLNDTNQPGDGVIVYSSTFENNDSLAWLDGTGTIVTQSQYAILKAAECEFGTPALPKLSNHHELVKAGMDQIRVEKPFISGTLGRKNSVKYRVYKRMERFLYEYGNTLFAPEGLKLALDTLFQYPLKESAIDTITRQMRAGISDENLAILLVSLNESDCLSGVTTATAEQNLLRIICSMSLIGGAP
jgi:superfamily II DNA or RNA helicase